MTELPVSCEVDDTSSEVLSTPPYFPVSLLKLVVMSAFTLGTYELYWFYKNWSLVRQREGTDIMPFWRAFFAFFFCYSLFKKIQSAAQSQGLQKAIAPGLLAVGWIIVTLLWRLPDPYWLATFAAVLFLLPVQSLANELNGATSPSHDRNARFTAWNVAAVVLGGLLLLSAVFGTFVPLG